MNAPVEIVEQHRFIEAWLRGTAEAALLTAFVDMHTSDFALYGPDGTVTGIQEVATGFGRARGTMPGIDVKIRNARVLTAADGIVVAVYEEHQRVEGSWNARSSTAVFVEDPAARHGLRWRHLHETWIDINR